MTSHVTSVMIRNYLLLNFLALLNPVTLPPCLLFPAVLLRSSNLNEFALFFFVSFAFRLTPTCFVLASFAKTSRLNLPLEAYAISEAKAPPPLPVS